MLSYEQALELIQTIPPSDATETVDLARAGDRILAEDLRMDRDQPPFDRAMMDGFAVAPDGDRREFDLIGSVHAGETAQVNPEPGQALRIMTGAPCPPGVAVVPVERTSLAGERVTVDPDAPLAIGTHIARRGEDAAKGATVVARGTHLDPLTLGAAAMAGATRVKVGRALTAAVITTGDEVGGSGDAAIADSNGPMLEGLMRALGLRTTRHHVRDDATTMAETFGALARDHQLLVTTGGVSMGDRDLVPGASEAQGFEQLLHRVAMQPGKPVFISRRAADDRLLVGLPGNPVSVLATAHLILAPVVARVTGAASSAWLDLPLGIPWTHRGRRRLFLPARFGAGGIQPLRWNGSGDLLAAASGDGLVDFEAGSTHAAGDRVRFLPYLGVRPGTHAPLERTTRS